MKSAVRGMGLLIAAMSMAHGATEFQDTKAVVDEVIADTATIPSTGKLEPLTTRIPFTNFRYPYVDAKLNVTFIADDPLYDGTKGSNHGIYRSYAGDGRLKALVSASDTPVPGTNAHFQFIRGLHVGDNLSDFVFSGITTDNKNGIYLWKDGVVSVVARSGETVVSTNSGKQTLDNVEYASYSGGRVLYAASTEHGPVLVLCNLADGSQKALAEGGQPIPGEAPDVFKYFSPQNWNNGSQVLFRAARVADPYDAAEIKRANRGLYGWVANAPGATPDYSPGGLHKFVDWETPVPGFPNATFVNLRAAQIRDDIIAFAADGPNFRGVYWMNSRGGPLQTIVDSATAMDGLFKGNFRGFAIYPAIIDRSIVFEGFADDYVGIFLYRPDEDALFLLTDNRTPVDGKRAVDFEIASYCLIGNRLALKAAFSDKSQGVYLATIPDKALPRTPAPAPTAP